MVFTGAAGTGKSWVARSLAGTYRKLGFVKGGQGERFTMPDA